MIYKRYNKLLNSTNASLAVSLELGAAPGSVYLRVTVSSVYLRLLLPHSMDPGCQLDRGE